MGSFSIWHWLIVLVIVMLIFGTKKLRNIGADLGGAVRGFKDGMREGGDKDRKVREEAAHEVPLPMHTDGFTYGHDAPDAMFLLCDVDSAIGGESVLIDDYAVLAGLRAEPAGSAGARLAEFVTGTMLDLTSPGMVPRSGTMVIAGHTLVTFGRRDWLLASRTVAGS